MTAAKIVEQFIDNEQQAMIWKFFDEGAHHGIESGLVLPDFVSGGKLESHAPLGEPVFQLTGNDFSERHFRRPDFQPNDFEFACD